MPLYEYECEKCRHRFERIQKFSDPPADRCPKCGAESVHKLISSPAIQFKGTGWYVTDYARKDSTASSTSESKEPASGDKAEKSGDKSDKSESKSESTTTSTKTPTSASS